ncbi:MAG: tripartite tricarboxylate transporter TctB family protein [Pseudomonadales bacterium]
MTRSAGFSNRFNPAAIGLSIFFAAYLLLATQIHIDLWSLDSFFTARTFPFFAGGIGFGSSVLISVHQFVRPSATLSTPTTNSFRYPPVLIMIVLMSLYITLIDLLGFIVSSIIFIATAGRLSGSEHQFLLITVAFAVPVLLGWILSLLGIYLDPGAIFAGVEVFK